MERQSGVPMTGSRPDPLGRPAVFTVILPPSALPPTSALPAMFFTNLSADLIPTPQECAVAAQIRSSSALFTVSCLQILFSATSLAILGFLVLNRDFHKLCALLGTDLKVIVGVGSVAFVAAGDLCAIGYYASAMIYNSRQLPDCGYIRSAAYCFPLRGFLHFTVIGFSILHLAVLLERIYASARGDENAERWSFVGRGLTAAMLITPILFLCYIYVDEEPLVGYRVYCIAGSHRSGKRSIFCTYALLVLDAVISAGDFLLYRFNMKQLERNVAGYDLKKSFQLREMRLSIRLIFPLSVVHAIAFLPWPVLYAAGRTEKTPSVMAAYVEAGVLSRTFYTALLPAALYVLMRRRPHRTGDGEWLTPKATMSDRYFDQLKKQFQ